MKTKILYVDDEPINLKLFEINFSKKYEVVVGNDGFEGLNVLSNNPGIMVVISDMKMPQMNGLEFIKKGKEMYPDKKFYILTGYEITHEIQEALNAGLIIKYFSKPFNYYDIDKSIEKALVNFNNENSV